MGEASIEVFLVNGIDGDSEWPFYGISALCHAAARRAANSKMPLVLSRSIMPTTQKYIKEIAVSQD